MSSKSFGHQKCNASNVIKFVSDVMYKNYEFITFISKYRYLRTPFLLKSSKLQPCLLTKFLKTQKKVKELEIMYQNAIFICIPWYSNICWFLANDANVSRIQRVCHVIHIFFNLLWVRYNCSKVHQCWICVAGFKEGAFAYSIRRQPQKDHPE